VFSRVGRITRSLRKEVPEAIGTPAAYDGAEVAAMLCEIGIAMIEVEQPTQLIGTRLRTWHATTPPRP
jgi:hypothetical protein